MAERDRRLDAQLALIASTVAGDGKVDRERLAQLRGTLDAGRGWRWRWRIVSSSGSLGSEDFPQMDSGPPGVPGPEPDGHRARPIEGQDQDGRVVHGRELRVQTSDGTVILTATAPRDVIGRPVHEALVPLLGMLAALGGLLGLAAAGQIRLGLRPLHRLHNAVAAIRSGAAATIEEDQPEELRPLAGELNALVRDNAAVLTAARVSAANLAHALKTPVATLALELRNDPRAVQVERINATIRHHLSRARVASPSARSITSLDRSLSALLQTISHIHADRGITIETRIAPAQSVAIDPADFDELLGNLLDNGFRHARTRVVVEASVEERMLRISVCDDGPRHGTGRTAPGNRTRRQAGRARRRARLRPHYRTRNRSVVRWRIES